MKNEGNFRRTVKQFPSPDVMLSIFQDMFDERGKEERKAEPVLLGAQRTFGGWWESRSARGHPCQDTGQGGNLIHDC